ncbi:MAG TPA: phosphoribosylformylglycinamidine synthase subunit PurQ [Candidatus Methanomethylophilaceae archaeon]|nr:phosphoribosylformylglycinamidine synthase subunit PurQ [Candidatus Methanomethylophilaceae archaeon]
MKDAKICILRIEGTNCEDETAEAFRMVGAIPELVHLNQMKSSATSDLKRNLEDYDALVIPGGSSAGDYLRGGALFAARIRNTIGDQLKKFVEDEKPVVGICNGFQVLMELGLLPGVDESMSETPTAALNTNDSGRFECRPTILRNENSGNCKFVSEIPKKGLVMFPVAHGEGKLISDDPDFVNKLEDNDQIVFRYVNPDGSDAEYPWNPSGSISGIAGICNPAGNVMGMMPHPERVMTLYTCPDWTRNIGLEEGDGMLIFKSIVKSI